jgi:hypothetical protein
MINQGYQDIDNFIAGERVVIPWLDKLFLFNE